MYNYIRRELEKTPEQKETFFYSSKKSD